MDPKAVLEKFVEAFESLNLEGMMERYAEEATSFFPVRHYASWINGKDEIRHQFEKVIGKIKRAGLESISLPVQDLQISEHNGNALATFQILDDSLSRRTIVLRKKADNWLIVHLHASNAPLEDAK